MNDRHFSPALPWLCLTRTLPILFLGGVLPLLTPPAWAEEGADLGTSPGEESLTPTAPPVGAKNLSPSPSPPVKSEPKTISTPPSPAPVAKTPPPPPPAPVVKTPPPPPPAPVVKTPPPVQTTPPVQSAPAKPQPKTISTPLPPVAEVQPVAPPPVVEQSPSPPLDELVGREGIIPEPIAIPPDPHRGEQSFAPPPESLTPLSTAEPEAIRDGQSPIGDHLAPIAPTLEADGEPEPLNADHDSSPLEVPELATVQEDGDFPLETRTLPRLEVSEWSDVLISDRPSTLTPTQKRELKQLQAEVGDFFSDSEPPPSQELQPLFNLNGDLNGPESAPPSTEEIEIPVIPPPDSPETPVLLENNPADLQEVLQLEIFPVDSPIVAADGRSTLALEGTIRNAQGELITEPHTVTLTSTAGEFVGRDGDADAPGFQVEALAGRFQAWLRSSLAAQRVQIRAALDGLTEPPTPGRAPVPEPVEAFTTVQFTTDLRPSIVSGLVNFRVGPQGTNFWGSRRDFLRPESIGRVTTDLDASVFAMGASEDWLLTLAYDSDRPLNETCDGISRLFRSPQHCEKTYPVYGDSSTVDYLTPSTDHFYVRMERTLPIPGAEPDYLMWGDYHTNEFARPSQTFTANIRQLHGFKTNYNLGNLQISALYSSDIQGFQRDAIAPDGTSGYYFLSRRRIIPGTENVFLEQASLEEPGLVTERQPLRRGPDYEIDYDRGTLLFRRPIERLQNDLFNAAVLQQILVTYQYEGDIAPDTNIFAGRTQYNLSRDFQNPSWLGFTYWQENRGAYQFEQYGGDVQLPFENGLFTAEYARSETNRPEFPGTGTALRFKLTKQLAPALRLNADYTSVSPGFSNDATTSFQPGQTRYGVNLTAQLDAITGARASLTYEANTGLAPLASTEPLDLFDTNLIPPWQRLSFTPLNNETRTLRVGLNRKIGTVQTHWELVNRVRADYANPELSSNASQFISNIIAPLSSRLTFRAQNEMNLGNPAFNPIYPTRTTLGLNWAAMPGVDLRLAHQFSNGGLFGDNAVTRFDTVVSRQLWGNTDITSRYSILGGINGWMGQGAVGLNHRWVIAPGLRANVGYERVLNDLFGSTAAGQRFAQGIATGQTAASLGFFGGESYHGALEFNPNEDWQASARFERRTSRAGTNMVLGAAATGKITPRLTTLLRFQQASSANGLLEGLPDTVNLRLGLAYRDPESDRFNALLSYEYRRNPGSIPETLLFGTGTQSRDHTLAVEMIYAPDWRWEFYTKYALRHSQTDLAQNFSNRSALHFGQLRATHRFNYRYDVTLEGRIIGQPEAGFTEVGSAVELGYYVTPDLRLALGYSFGGVNDRDFGSYRGDGGIYFGISMKVNELLRGFGRQQPVARED